MNIINEILTSHKRYECDTEVYTDDHETCLLRAVKNRYAPICDALLRHGSKVSARDSHGDNPLHIGRVRILMIAIFFFQILRILNSPL